MVIITHENLSEPYYWMDLQSTPPLLGGRQLLIVLARFSPSPALRGNPQLSCNSKGADMVDVTLVPLNIKYQTYKKIKGGTKYLRSVISR